MTSEKRSSIIQISIKIGDQRNNGQTVIYVFNTRLRENKLIKSRLLLLSTWWNKYACSGCSVDDMYRPVIKRPR